MAQEAKSSKLDGLRCRDDDPSDGVKGSARGESSALQYLYPAEVDRFLSCDDVPLHWRRLLAVAVYTYARAGELRALTWDDVDLQHGVNSITRAIDRTSGGVKATKSKRPRPIPIEPALLPLLRVMRREAHGHGPVIADVPSERDFARGLRRWLTNAGIERRSLHDRGPSSRPVPLPRPSSDGHHLDGGEG
jgi:integrase